MPATPSAQPVFGGVSGALSSQLPPAPVAPGSRASQSPLRASTTGRLLSPVRSTPQLQSVKKPALTPPAPASPAPPATPASQGRRSSSHVQTPQALPSAAPPTTHADGAEDQELLDPPSVAALSETPTIAVEPVQTSELVVPETDPNNDIRASLGALLNIVHQAPITGTTESIREIMNKHQLEIEKMQHLCELHSHCINAMRETLDKKLSDDIASLNSELRKEEDMHSRRVTEITKQTKGLEQEREEHQLKLRSASGTRPVWKNEDGTVDTEPHPVDIDAQNRLVSFYQEYNKSKLPMVVNTLLQYAGREEELFSILVGKYGPEPPMTSHPLPSGWNRVKSKRGDFYYKHLDGGRQWERPA